MLIGSHIRAAGMTRSKMSCAGLFLTSYPGYRTQGRQKNRLIGDGFVDRTGAVPNGYLAPHAWLLGITSGGMGSSQVAGSASGVINLAGGRNAVAVLDGVGDINALGQLVSSAVAALTGSGGVSDAQMVAVLQALATLAGSGSADADIEALAWAYAVVEAAGTLNLVSYATGILGAEIIPNAGSDVLTPGQIADAVWNAATASYDEPGTTGGALANATEPFSGGQFYP